MRMKKTNGKKTDERNSIGHRLLFLVVIATVCLPAYTQAKESPHKANQYTVSGYVHQENGEPLINVTVMDLSGMKGTVSNEHGFFSLTLPEGRHSIRFLYIGFREKTETLELNKDTTLQVYLDESYQLDEVTVVADLNSPIHTTLTGKVSLTARDLHTEYALLSSPDVVKTLQNQPGVAAGTELISGLYVHGGNNDENLFLLDGTPLYQINHLGGLFSAFNADVIKNIDFYKSGFPARYGGRVSSVVDVRTKDGDMKEYHGSVSISLLDGRVQYEGPIVKNRTSFNVAMRRTWLDALSAPVLAIYNSSRSDGKMKARYAFHDINTKITHLFSDKSKAYISLYSGNDVLKVNNRQYFPDEQDRNKFNLQWGNLTAAAHWNYQFSPKLFANFAGVYTRNRSVYDYHSEVKSVNADEMTGITRAERSNHSRIDDIGYRMEFDYRPNVKHHIRIGSNYLYHIFRPQSQGSNNASGDADRQDTVRQSHSSFYRGHEITAYAEDDIRLSEKWRMNLGLHYTLFRIDRKNYHSVEPRLSLKYQWNENMAIKASYTQMSQLMHLLSNSYLNLPTDFWVPSTRNVRPLHSSQYAAGLYMQFPSRFRFNVEGFYKTTDNLVEYFGGNGLMPSINNWESMIRKGKGRAYGLEFLLAYRKDKLSAEAGYTLSWSEQKFPQLYSGWYPSKFDNRHKIYLNARYRFSKRIDVYAAWTYHSGNRITLPTQYVNGPFLPEAPGHAEAEWIREKPNNAALPAYHRLDLGANFRRTTKKGYERIWNISIYNAYSRMNALYGKVEQLPDGSFRGKATGILPIIPSFSYTLKF